ncbi:MAG TPA: hypothetical protein VGH98_03005 [Gemmatimonadaceae bacterium]|jgi:hypothetical protein
MNRVSVAALLGALGAAMAATRADAQCRPPANSHEARLLAFYESPIVFSMAGAPERLAAGDLRLGGELVPVPSPDPALQRPNYCYANTMNNTKLAPVFGRPRLTLGLPAGFAIDASYLPNVTVSSAQASLVSVAVTHTASMPLAGERIALVVRLDGTGGQVRGAITCPRASLQTIDESVPCYGTQPSRDTFHPNSFGLELAAGTRASERVDVYAGGGVRSLRPRFQAGFSDALGNVDRTTIDVDLVRATAFAGVTARVRDRIALSGQLYIVPADVTTLRLGAQYTLR